MTAFLTTDRTTTMLVESPAASGEFTTVTGGLFNGATIALGTAYLAGPPGGRAVSATIDNELAPPAQL